MRWDCRYSSCEMMYLEVESDGSARMYLHHSPQSADRASADDILAGKWDATVRNLYSEQVLAELKAEVQLRQRAQVRRD